LLVVAAMFQGDDDDTPLTHLIWLRLDVFHLISSLTLHYTRLLP
jgi:hypothetical protein